MDEIIELEHNEEVFSVEEKLNRMLGFSVSEEENMDIKEKIRMLLE